MDGKTIRKGTDTLGTGNGVIYNSEAVSVYHSLGALSIQTGRDPFHHDYP